MENLRLVRPEGIYINQYMNFIDECKDDIKKCGMDYYIPLSDNDNFLKQIQLLNNYEVGINLPDGWVPASTYWLMDRDCNHIFGIITIRHSLIGYLLFRGGHISYYIRASARFKGYATNMLRLALEKCKDLSLGKVMITCAKNNIGSARTIQNNSGILHSEDIEDGEEFQRYWINICSQKSGLEKDIQV